MQKDPWETGKAPWFDAAIDCSLSLGRAVDLSFLGVDLVRIIQYPILMMVNRKIVEKRKALNG